MSSYINIEQICMGGNRIETNIVDLKRPFHFYMGDEKMSIELTEIEATNYYMVLSLVLTLGEPYWHNFCRSGGSVRLDIEFCKFIQNNIKQINRDIVLEKIID